MRKIKFLDNISALKERFEKLVGISDYKFSFGDLKIIDKWFNVWNYGEEMIKEAYDRCLRIKGKFILKYVDGIIKSWKNDGIYDKEHLKIGVGKHPSEERNVSYNLEDHINYCESILFGKSR